MSTGKDSQYHVNKTVDVNSSNFLPTENDCQSHVNTTEYVKTVTMWQPRMIAQVTFKYNRRCKQQ